MNSKCIHKKEDVSWSQLRDFYIFFTLTFWTSVTDVFVIWRCPLDLKNTDDANFWDRAMFLSLGLSSKLLRPLLASCDAYASFIFPPKCQQNVLDNSACSWLKWSLNDLLPKTSRGCIYPIILPGITTKLRACTGNNDDITTTAGLRTTVRCILVSW